MSRSESMASVLLALALASTVAGAQPHQSPLINRIGVGASPNLVLTLDDSGSMAFQHMPEERIVLGPWTVDSPVGSLSVRFHPDDRGPQAILLGAELGVVAAVPGSANWRQRLMRSPDTNTLYYNPAIRYRPWLGADGVRWPEAVARAARIDPVDSMAGVVDLTARQTWSALWCFAPPVPGLVNNPAACSWTAQVYEPGLYYRLRRTDGRFLNPRLPGSWEEFDVNRSPTAPKAPDRTDCAGAQCTLDEERRNFANWFVYHRSRMLLAKSAVGEVLATTGNELRVGYGRINRAADSVDGFENIAAVVSGVRDFTANRRQTVLDWLYQLPVGGGTPLRRAVQGVTDYFSTTGGGNPWTDDPGNALSTKAAACRRSYHLLVSDGYWNDSVGDAGLKSVGNVDGTQGLTITGTLGRSWTYTPAAPFKDDTSNTLADYAMDAWGQDLQPNLANQVPPTTLNPSFWQNVTTFTLGLGVRGQLDPARDAPALARGDLPWSGDKIDDLWHAAVNGRGQYFSAQSPADLRQSLQRALRSVVERELREAGVAIASGELVRGNRKYIPRYRTGAWTGDVEAFALDDQGAATARVWSASQRLPSWTDRNVLTWDVGQMSPSGVRLRWEDLSPSARTRVGSEALVDYVRGDASREQEGSDWRVRGDRLADFINSPPVFVKEAVDPGHLRLPGLGDAYRTYVQEIKRRRVGVLYVGGNGGLLHGFRDSQTDNDPADGREVLAYVPGALLGALRDLADPAYGSPARPHRYYVDGPLQEADVHVPAPGAVTPGWRNYLFGSAGAGGRVVFALDVTRPEQLDRSSVRWEVDGRTEPDLGVLRFPIQSGMLPNGRWVALFGNGSFSDTGTATLFIVDVATGAVRRLTVGANPSITSARPANGLGGVGLVRDAFGRIVAAYAGDLTGRLFRFEFDPASEATGHFRVGNAGQPVFEAGEAQPIVQAPLVVPMGLGRWLVAVGTGQLLSEADARDRSPQAIHVFRDDTALRGLGTRLTPAHLVPRTLQPDTRSGSASGLVRVSGSAVDLHRQPGWTLPLVWPADDPALPSLRVIHPLFMAGSRSLLVSAIAPGQAVGLCDTSDGRGLNLMLPLDTGLAPDHPQLDTNADGRIDPGDSDAVGYLTDADGIDAVITRAPGRGEGPQAGVPADSTSPEGGATPGASPCLLVSLQGSVGERRACLPLGSLGRTAGLTVRDRAWRRILVPPF
jgi:type IV pilus assembly protein PilY1